MTRSKPFRGSRDILTDDPVVSNLLKQIWGFASPRVLDRAKALSCFYHYENLLSNQYLLDDQSTSLRYSDTQCSDVINLITEVKRRVDLPIAEIHAYLQNNPPPWLLDAQGEETIDNLLSFSTRLWLFTRPSLGDKRATIREAVQGPLMRIGRPSTGWLWLDFSAHTLTRKGRLRISWTSDISEHLTFASKSVVRVFSHSSVLEQYERAFEGDIYPKGLLREIRRTLDLLWPAEKLPVARRVRRLQDRHNIDLESAMVPEDFGHTEKFDLRSYPFFGERLLKLQERLEAEERRRGTSRGVQIAIWGIVLTAVFGLISAVTGIMQVYASFQGLKSSS